MAIDYQIADTDRLLDELELAARSEISNSVFFDQLLASLRLLIRSESTAIVLHLKPSGWVLLAQNGVATFDLREDLAALVANDITGEFVTGLTSGKSWLAASIRNGKMEEGCLVVTFDCEVPPSGLASLSAIVIAFAEVLAMRQVSRLEKLLEGRWKSIQTLTEKLCHVSTIKEGSKLLANRLCSEFLAARVSIVDSPGRSDGRPKTIAISGSPNLDRRSPDIVSLERIASEVLVGGKPVFRQESPQLIEAVRAVEARLLRMALLRIYWRWATKTRKGDGPIRAPS